MIAVFAYDFAHRKSYDFVSELILNNILCLVLAAPQKKLATNDSNVYFHNRYVWQNAKSLKELCSEHGIIYVNIEHENISQIKSIVQEKQCHMGLVAGARILKKEIIELFKHGIFNIHPGKIPETSGLDSFFYSIRNNVPMGVTGHFIDHKVDAGHFLCFEELFLNPDDTLESITNNLYQLQLVVLRQFIQVYKKDNFICTTIIRPYKNQPLKIEEKLKIIEKFPIWRNTIYYLQQGKLLIRACKENNLDIVKSILSKMPSLLEFKTQEGWNPLIVSAFNQNKEIVLFLLETGANVNATGLKGTTVLMYAKTNFLLSNHQDYSMINALLDFGAEIYRKDAFGKDIFDYLILPEHKDFVLYLKNWSK